MLTSQIFPNSDQNKNYPQFKLQIKDSNNIKTQASSNLQDIQQNQLVDYTSIKISNQTIAKIKTYLNKTKSTNPKADLIRLTRQKLQEQQGQQEQVDSQIKSQHIKSQNLNILTNIDKNIKQYYKIVDLSKALDTLLLKYLDDPIIETIRKQAKQFIQFRNPFGRILKKIANPRKYLQKQRKQMEIKIQKQAIKYADKQIYVSLPEYFRIVQHQTDNNTYQDLVKIDQQQLNCQKQLFKIQDYDSYWAGQRQNNEQLYLDAKVKNYNPCYLKSQQYKQGINGRPLQFRKKRTKKQYLRINSQQPKIFPQNLLDKYVQQQPVRIKQQNQELTKFLNIHSQQIQNKLHIPNEEKSNKQQYQLFNYDFDSGFKEAVVFIEAISKAQLEKFIQIKKKMKNIQKSINLAVAQQLAKVYKPPLSKGIFQNDSKNFQNNSSTLNCSQQIDFTQDSQIIQAVQNNLDLKNCHVCRKCWKFFDDGHRLGGHMAKRHPHSRFIKQRATSKSFASKRKLYFKILKSISQGKDILTKKQPYKQKVALNNKFAQQKKAKL